jgi:hypothetical protein
MKHVFITLLLIISLSWLQFSCKKEPIVREIHGDTIITGNTIPNYTGVPTLTITLYVNKLYIDLIGRQATQNELTNNVNQLIQANLSSAARSVLVENLFTDSLFYRRMFETTSDDFINGTGIAAIESQIDFFNYLAYFDSLNGNPLSSIYYDFENDKMYQLMSSAYDLQNGSIDINTFYFRFLNNYFYDQVNMGTENFVKGTFDDLFRRPPVTEELDAAIKMVDNVSTTLFLQSGSNKGDYMNIVTHTDAFYEGITRRYYQQFFLRQATSQEILTGISIIKPSGDYKALQKQLLISTEYAGF